MKKWLIFVALLVLAFVLVACGEEEAVEPAEEEVVEEAVEEETPEEAVAEGTGEAFTIGVIPAQTVGELQSAIDKLQAVLDEALPQDVAVEVYPDYNGVVEAMNFDQIDMAYLGPLTYVIAQEQSNAEAIVTQLVDGEPFYHSYIITQADNEAETLDDLLANPGEVDFAFGDPNSTSGSLIPSIELQKRGVYTDEDDYEFNSAQFTGSHDATALAVQNGQVTAGAIDSAIYNQLVEEGTINPDEVKVIWESDQLFQYPWAVTEETSNETIAAIREAFLAIEDQEILDAFGADGFTEASPEDYESIRQAAIQQGIIEE
ncbi:phosphate/phosphite/phosphonate ABC transporter substrate-binding protein [Planococcus lenghuensis]|uniref:Phosphonate ABC transporter substrate-binding protein n=1 Tax=Planococcus lenghuensis TaxID=2213202 RepID=A0A1Q2KY99_9BACL|nr:phosphate/phosphite/phosphonate ABC transporter substrate-binding protein [Planococcus lenghuensis]AQQ53188.1 phosphonate ABC transporter substrate-binding protein [Planococcus lenghuensis]